MDLRLLPYQPDRDVYRLLGLTPSAGRAEIVGACRRLAQAFHPDRNESQRATEEMQVVNAVRSLMTDPGSRAEYDRARLRFWSATARRIPVAVPRPLPREHKPTPHVPKPAPPPPVALPLTRTARAAMAGMLATLRSLPPARCDFCAAWPEPDHRFCAECGAPLPARVQVGRDRPR
jgi:hypothetical protein